MCQRIGIEDGYSKLPANIESSDSKEEQSPVPENIDPGVVYAGFWKRLLANCIDLMMIPVLKSPIIIIPIVTYALNDGDITPVTDIKNPVCLAGMAIAVLYITLLPWLYFAILESSKWQATIGKKLLGLKVVEVNGNRIGFWKITLKLLLQLLVFLIPFAALCAFHALAGYSYCLVIGVTAYLFSYTNSKRQTPFDLAVKRAIIDTRAKAKSAKIYKRPFWFIVVPLSIVFVVFSTILCIADVNDDKEWIASGIPEVAQIVVADRNITKGETIGPLDVVECPVPPTSVFNGSIVCSKLAIGTNTVVPIRRGDLLHVNYLEDGKTVAQKQLALVEQNKSDLSSICSKDSTEIRNKMDFQKNGKAFFLRVTNDVPEEEVIKMQDVEIQSSNSHEVTYDALQCKSKYGVVGRFPKYGIRSGQILTSKDIDYSKLASDRACFAKTTISAGTMISGNQIEYRTITAEECPSSAVISKEVILNKTALHNLKPGQLIRSVDVLDEFQQ